MTRPSPCIRKIRALPTLWASAQFCRWWDVRSRSWRMTTAIPRRARVRSRSRPRMTSTITAWPAGMACPCPRCWMRRRASGLTKSRAICAPWRASAIRISCALWRGWTASRRASKSWPSWSGWNCWRRWSRTPIPSRMVTAQAYRSSRGSLCNGIAMRRRWRNPPSRRSRQVRRNSCPSSGKTPSSPGCVTSSPGAFRGSSGGGIAFRPGTGRRGASLSSATRRRQKPRRGRSLAAMWS